MESPSQDLISISLRTRVRALIADQSGIAAMTLCLMLGALLTTLALVVDTSVWERNKAIIQSAADSAALSAVVAAQSGATTDQAKIEALGIAATNGFTNGANGVAVTVNNAPYLARSVATPMPTRSSSASRRNSISRE